MPLTDLHFLDMACLRKSIPPSIRVKKWNWGMDGNYKLLLFHSKFIKAQLKLSQSQRHAERIRYEFL